MESESLGSKPDFSEAEAVLSSCLRPRAELHWYSLGPTRGFISPIFSLIHRRPCRDFRFGPAFAVPRILGLGGDGSIYLVDGYGADEPLCGMAYGGAMGPEILSGLSLVEAYLGLPRRGVLLELGRFGEALASLYALVVLCGLEARLVSHRRGGEDIRAEGSRARALLSASDDYLSGLALEAPPLPCQTTCPA